MKPELPATNHGHLPSRTLIYINKRGGVPHRWCVTDLLNGQGSQTDTTTTSTVIGVATGLVTAAGGAVTVEGTYKFSGGDGEFRGLTGGGKFKTVLKSETERVQLGGQLRTGQGADALSNNTARPDRRLWDVPVTCPSLSK
jgi:hypothetical protein